MNALLRYSSALALAGIIAGCSSSADPGGGGDDDTGVGGDDSSSTVDSTPKTDTKTGDDTTPGTDTAVEDSGTGDSAKADSTATDGVTTDTTAADTTATDSVTTDTTAADTAADTTDSGPATTAWGAACTGASTCAGEAGRCATSYGSPVCIHACSGQPAYSLCEGSAGMCVPTTKADGTTEQLCIKKCGDTEKATCGAGAACALLGYRDHSAADAGFDPVGACVPECSATGADACTAAGMACDPARHACSPIGCTGFTCPTGSSCVSGSSYCASSSPTALYGNCTNGTTANGCTSNLCFGEPASPGFCSQFCNSETGATTCGAGGVCWYDNNIDPPSVTGSGTVAYPAYPFTVIGGRASGACLKRCTDSIDCPSGFYCSETNGGRACVPGTLPTVGAGSGKAPGEVCHLNTDCSSGSCGKATGYVDGICLRGAAGTCPSTTVQNATTALECDKICDPTVDLTCAGSLVCVKGAGTTPSTCALGLCRENLDCATGFVCDHKTANCVATGTTSTATDNTGVACTTSATCSGKSCIAETTSPSAWPGGYCSSVCTVLPDLGDTCTNGTICSASRMGALGNCLKLCDTAAPFSVYGTCRAGYKCQVLGDPRFGFCVTT